MFMPQGDPSGMAPPRGGGGVMERLAMLPPELRQQVLDRVRMLQQGGGGGMQSQPVPLPQGPVDPGGLDFQTGPGSQGAPPPPMQNAAMPASSAAAPPTGAPRGGRRPNGPRAEGGRRPAPGGGRRGMPGKPVQSGGKPPQSSTGPGGWDERLNRGGFPGSGMGEPAQTYGGPQAAQGGKGGPVLSGGPQPMDPNTAARDSFLRHMQGNLGQR